MTPRQANIAMICRIVISTTCLLTGTTVLFGWWAALTVFGVFGLIIEIFGWRKDL